MKKTIETNIKLSYFPGDNCFFISISGETYHASHIVGVESMTNAQIKDYLDKKAEGMIADYKDHEVWE